jgi:hypothetical protein
MAVRIAWTGHRPEVFRDHAQARARVDTLAWAAVARWPAAEFVCGGQRGVDQWAAAAGLAAGRPVHLVLPSPPSRFTVGWPDADRASLERLLERAASLAVLDATGTYGPLAYDWRNEALVRGADRLIAVWTGLRRGGTFYTLCAAAVGGVVVEAEILPAAAGVPPGGRGL